MNKWSVDDDVNSNTSGVTEVNVEYIHNGVEIVWLYSQIEEIV